MLSQLRFSEIGSLFEEQGTFKVKECLSRGHILHERYSLEDIPRGPFPSEEPFYYSLIAAFTEHAEILRLSHHCFIAPTPNRGEYQSDHEYHEACERWTSSEDEESRAPYFRDDILKRSIARKLTLVSQWKSQYVPSSHQSLRKNGELFVADDRLWKWILDVGLLAYKPEKKAAA